MNKNHCNNKTTEEFVKEAKSLWDSRYDYSKVNYINNYTKVELKCNKCSNSFLTLPNDHIRKSHKTGCPHCAGNIRKTTEQFIKEASEVHGNKYDYSKVNYINEQMRVKIICKECQKLFLRRYNQHIKEETGCPHCLRIKQKQQSIITRINAKKRYIIKKEQGKQKTLEKRLNVFNDLIKEAKEKHNNKYDYSQSTYKGLYKKIKIVCNTCLSSFEQTIKCHLLSTDCCPFCYISQFKNKFISESKAIHGDKYDYSKIDYKNADTRVKILCKKCNKYFSQKPSSHSSGSGCLCQDKTKICNMP